jgi:nicotinate-nucleotide pyrophosphorylase (carboxylating)
MRPQYLTEESITNFIKAALSEDIGPGDYTTLGSIREDLSSEAHLLLKGEGILAGIELAEQIFRYVDDSLDFQAVKNDGDSVESGEVGFSIKGSARSILSSERLVLNCMQRMTAVATYTHYMSSLIKGTHARLLDTRKTTPLFRLPEKWAVLIGGGVNHRFGLFDMILLKDNHIDFAGGIKPAIEKTVKYLELNGLDLEIEVEVRNLKELNEVLEIGKVDRVLLDNMLPSEIRQAIDLIDGEFETEASGGITEKNIAEIAETGVDYISVGALTHSYKSIDMSLKAI